MKNKLYIAYGSNLNLPQMAQRCPTAKVVSASEVKDHALLFRGGRHGAVATIEPLEGSSVPVLLWEITPRDELALDRYEGYPSLYEKQTLDLEVDGRRVSAMVYVMTPGHRLGYPAAYYYDVIREGYRTAGFDPNILEQAVERTEQMMAAEPELEAQQFSIGQQKWW